MRKSIAPLLAIAFGTAITLRADILAQWTFEINTPADLTDSSSLPGVAADVGTGTAFGFHANPLTDWTTPAGNGSANSLSANTWSVNDLYQFEFSTIGYAGIGISFDQVSSGTGPRDFSILYSRDGGPFTAIAGGNYSVLPNAAPNPVWNSGTSSSLYTYIFDLSTIPALDNATTVAIRLANTSTVSANGGTVAAGGTSRIDNFAAFSPVPEPSTMALAVMGGLLAFGLLRRKR